MQFPCNGVLFSHTRNEVLLTHAVTWINLEGITLSERSPDTEVMHCTISFTITIQNKQIYRESKTKVVRKRTEGEREWGVTA